MTWSAFSKASAFGGLHWCGHAVCFRPARTAGLLDRENVLGPYLGRGNYSAADRPSKARPSTDTAAHRMTIPGVGSDIGIGSAFVRSTSGRRKICSAAAA